MIYEKKFWSCLVCKSMKRKNFLYNIARLILFFLIDLLFNLKKEKKLLEEKLDGPQKYDNSMKEEMPIDMRMN